VTLAHTLRYTRFLLKLAEARTEALSLTTIVHRWLEGVLPVFVELSAETTPMSDRQRREIMDRLGQNFSEYRMAAYNEWPADQRPLAPDALNRLLKSASIVLERSFRSNRRSDGLFHSYNTMELGASVSIQRLFVMLEGQVAALDAQVLKPQETVALLDAMYASPLYRADQHSFLLYPDKILPDFGQRNSVPADAARAIGAVRRWEQTSERRILSPDAGDVFRFHADLKNAEVLEERLDALEQTPDFESIDAEDRTALLKLYERVFNHSAFTGRSSSMYGYEGLGCIYWHMVAKLLLAVQESYQRATETKDAFAPQVAAAYDRVRAGFGFNKDPGHYGAFPTDAYSHTPGHSGAQQPGMTGQVKEQVLTRFGELGVRVEDGSLSFDPSLLYSDELIAKDTDWSFVGGDGTLSTARIPAGGLAFSLAGVPIVYATRARTPSEERVHIVREDKTTKTTDGLRLSPDDTRALFGRLGKILRIEVDLLPTRLREKTEGA
ncbi:MAG: hypothetical protein AAF449_10255, partial [Myxococcota bacterium]